MRSILVIWWRPSLRFILHFLSSHTFFCMVVTDISSFSTPKIDKIPQIFLKSFHCVSKCLPSQWLNKFSVEMLGNERFSLHFLVCTFTTQLLKIRTSYAVKCSRICFEMSTFFKMRVNVPKSTLSVNKTTLCKCLSDSHPNIKVIPSFHAERSGVGDLIDVVLISVHLSKFD